jgi:hypothetical protein
MEFLKAPCIHIHIHTLGINNIANNIFFCKQLYTQVIKALMLKNIPREVFG